MYVYIHIYIYIYIYIYIHMNTHVQEEKKRLLKHRGSMSNVKSDEELLEVEYGPAPSVSAFADRYCSYAYIHAHMCVCIYIHICCLFMHIYTYIVTHVVSYTRVWRP
jgi:hypothetical protein